MDPFLARRNDVTAAPINEAVFPDGAEPKFSHAVMLHHEKVSLFLLPTSD